MPTAEFPGSQSKTENAINHTVLTIVEKEAHTPVSQQKQVFVTLDPRRIAHVIWETSLSVQDRLRKPSMGCWNAEPVNGDYSSLQPQAPAADPKGTNPLCSSPDPG